MRVTSAYRCPKYNAQISDTGLTGPHTKGMAVDIYVTNPDAHALIKVAMELGVDGLGVSQKGGSRFIHLDKVGRKAVWSYD